MTGSGTVGDPYIIYDVTDLQAMINNLAAYYELANDIDASATSGWNGGLGFEPVGAVGGSHYLVSASDVETTGFWSANPTPPATLWDKIDDGGDWDTEPFSDSDTTYIQAAVIGRFVELHDITNNIPSFATINYIRGNIVVHKQATVNAATTVKPGLLVNGTWYPHATIHSHPGSSYSWYSISGASWTTNPDTGAAWTVDDVQGTGANPFQGFGIDLTVLATAWYRVSTLSFQISMTVASFTGHFDGKGYKISNLFINRPYQIDIGLFGLISSTATIVDVELETCNITGKYYVGSLIGRLGTTISSTSVVLNGCHASGTVIGSDYVGGLIGWDSAGGGGGA
jgi:hypothetical protein